MKTNFFIMTIISSMLLSHSYSVFAEDVPATLMRLSARTPDVVLSKGLEPAGENKSFISHVRGVSCGFAQKKGDSNFVSVSDNINFLRSYARSMFFTKPDLKRLYLYTIRPSENFYNAAKNLQLVPGASDYVKKASTMQGEYVALGGIDRRQIIKVDTWELGELNQSGQREIKVVNTTINEGYVDAPPKIGDIIPNINKSNDAAPPKIGDSIPNISKFNDEEISNEIDGDYPLYFANQVRPVITACIRVNDSNNDDVVEVNNEDEFNALQKSPIP
ncbi:enterotoxin A family protein [Klebsiella aerogenes]|uniref:enterotoxin A family protein n=1 Tax=Klebsiella aerogenes TaxID=548 RepID=UPI0007503283|nr:enterotoxin A family protein [Klebsiella aerogenes]KUQ07729.1 hypothetical protein AWI08_04510 [Klebsiella aerogenes]